MSKYISREEVLSRINRTVLCSTHEAREIIDSIPSADVRENIHGHWIRVTDKAGYLVWECDKCGWQKRLWTNYCPDCGCCMYKEK